MKILARYINKLRLEILNLRKQRDDYKAAMGIYKNLYLGGKK